jgi:hypothetical protein
LKGPFVDLVPVKFGKTPAVLTAENLYFITIQGTV